MRENLVSVVGGRAVDFVDSKTPSKLIPFQGEFPILENYKLPGFMEAIRNTEFINELSEEHQEAVRKGDSMATLEKNFEKYLRDKGIDKYSFLKKTNSEKSDILVRWMEDNNVDSNRLNIK